ncbi:MAG: hypothetical protein KDA84_24855, partial [Planctomycetaceae bacterium]|nr:hypothetical protein [Planctomycetaceae bacterium]
MKTCSLISAGLALFAVFSAQVAAQGQTIVPEAPQVSVEDPLEKAALDTVLQKVAKTPLPRLTDETGTNWQKTLTPVFEFIEKIPTSTVDDAAYAFAKNREKLTAEDRKKNEETFDLIRDRDRSPDAYWGQPVPIPGPLKELKKIHLSGDGNEGSPWYVGQLALSSPDKTVRFVTRSLPEGFPTDDCENVPVAVVGYNFPLKSEEADSPAEPLIVARSVHWLSAQGSERDPLRETALTEELQKTAETPLPPLTAESANRWRESLTPLYQYFDEKRIPIRTLEEAAH